MKTLTSLANIVNRPVFLDQVRLLVDLAYAMAQGDEACTNELRDQIEETADELTPSETLTLNQISGDLYMLEGTELLQPLGISTLEYVTRLRRAYFDHDYKKTLHLLRKRQAVVDPVYVAYLRARSYAGLGYYSAALAFMKYAAKLTPAIPDFEYFAAAYCLDLNYTDEAIEHARELERRGGNHAEHILFAACIMFSAAKAKAIADIANLIDEIRILAEKAIQNGKAMSSLSKAEFSIAYILVGLTLAAKGDYVEAIRAYSSAIEQDDRSEAAYRLRGNLLMERDEAAGLRDYEKAISLGTEDAVPYIVLANRAEINGRHKECIRLSEKFLYHTNPRIASYAHELVGIATFYLTNDRNRALDMFAQALELSPHDERLKHNFQVLSTQPESKLMSAISTFEQMSKMEQHNLLPEYDALSLTFLTASRTVDQRIQSLAA